MRLFVPLFIMILTIFSIFGANSAISTEYAVEVHPHGILTESSCLMLFSIDNAAIEMEIYNTDQFRMIGDYGDKAVTFAIQAMQCSHNVADSIALSIRGIPDISDSDTFIVNRQRDDSLSQEDVQKGQTGLGLAIFYRKGRLVTPDERANLHSRRFSDRI